MKPPQHPAMLVPLSLPALLYGAAVRARNWYYDRPETSRRAALPVLSVGNLTVGGTGKTPFVAWLAGRLRELGARPAIVSRGYGGQAGRGPLVVSSGEGPLCDAARAGDEPYLLARLLRGVPVLAGSDRWRGAEVAAEAGADVVILDDGFQHRRLARDLDIVLLDASNPFGNYRLLPAGLLREPVRALSRADVVVITRCRQQSESIKLIERVVRHHNLDIPILRAGHKSAGFFNPAGEAVNRPASALAFCGIGNPNRFRIDLESEGIELVDFRVFSDHHVYSPREIVQLRRQARDRGAVLLTTEKDLVRLPDALRREEGPPLLALRIEPLIFEPEPLLRAVQRALQRAAA